MLTLKSIPVIEGNSKIDGFHLMWNPFYNGHLPVSGYSIWRRRSLGRRDKPVCRIIDGSSLDTLHNNFFLLLNSADAKFQKISFRPMHPDHPNWPGSTMNAAGSLASPVFMFAYDVFFTETVFNSSVVATIKPDAKFVFAIAYNKGRVVRSKFIQGSLAFTFEEPADKISFYIPGMAESIRVCYSGLRDNNDEGWKLIRKNLCLPFKGFGENVSTTQQEFDLFRGRLNDDLSPDFGYFGNISSLLKDTHSLVNKSLLPATSIMKFMDVQGSSGSKSSKLNAAPFAMLQTFSVYHNWRMGLGFGYLDQEGLEPNAAYDYRITAGFHKNVTETIYDFHTVPLLTRVGPAFALRDVFIYTDPKTIVENFPSQSSTTTEAFIKAVRISGPTRIIFPEAIDRFAIYCVSNPGDNLRILGQLSSIPVTERVEIKFGAPAAEVVLTGHFILSGIAIETIAAGEDPRSIVTLTGYSFNQVYANTKRLEPPSALEAESLQSSPQPLEKKAPEGLGFLLRWEHPSGYDDTIDPNLWPPDCPLPPPAELGYYKLEYMNTSASPVDPWHMHDELSDEDPTGIVLPGDDYRAASLPVSFGTDLLSVFPTTRLAGGTFTSFQRFKHLLENRSGGQTAVPGAFYKYRLWSVDLAGRQSMAPTESTAKRLEKRQPPPAPAGLADKYISPTPDNGYVLPDPRTDLRPQNVYAKVIKSSSAHLTAQERNLLGDRDHITILTWTWGEEERRLDAYTKEFRVYIRTHEHGLIKGEFASVATANVTDWNMDVELSIPVTAGEFVDSFITLNRTVFKIVAHNAGTSITLQVSPPRTMPGAVPGTGRFQLYRKPAGENARPTSWTDRIAVVPVTANAVYQYIFETGTLVGDSNNILGHENLSYEITPLGSPTRCWLGVSAADAEPYVNDQLTVTGDFSPRAGNEGAIVTAAIQVNFTGRPEFNPPPPLDDVDVFPLDEVSSEKLVFAVTPIDLLTFLQPTDMIKIEKITGTDLLSLLHVGEQGIQLSEAENRDIIHDWLLNPADEAELRAAFADSSKPIPAKFIWAIVRKNELNLASLWKSVGPGSVSCSALMQDYLPNRTDRYIYRARLTNEIGIPSEAAALFPAVWRTRDKTAPPSVIVKEIRLTEEDDGTVVNPLIKMDAGMAATIKGILVFPGGFTEADNVTEEDLKKASLLKIPNRPDFLSEQLYRVSVKGIMVEPLFVPITDAQVIVNGASAQFAWNNIELDFAYEQTAVIWAVAVTRDNVISKLGSYKKIMTGPTPPLVPDLQVQTNAERLEISFTNVIGESVQYRIEKADSDNADNYKPVTAWFVAKLGVSTAHFAVPAGDASYRLKVRKNSRDFAGSPVEFAI